MYNDFVVCCPLYILATEDTFSPNNTFWLEKKKWLLNGYIEHIYKLILLKKKNCLVRGISWRISNELGKMELDCC